MKKWMKGLAAAVGLLILCALAFVTDYYRTDVSIEQLQAQHPDVLYRLEDNVLRVALEGGGADTGIIFYPGAKVEYGHLIR